MSVFYSAQFLCFFVILLILYYTVLRRYQWLCLLGFSLLFYLFSGWKSIIFIFISSLTVYFGARNISSAEKLKSKKGWMLVVLLLNLGILAFFKYINPHIEGISVPLGLSFYTFIAIGYLLDVYYEKYQPERNYGRFLLFITYFPQLIQGPINRYGKIQKDLYGQHNWDWQRAKQAIYIILFGLMKKYAIANMLTELIGIILDDHIKDVPGSVIVFGIFLYSIQQYADFSGGIDIVIGLSELLGIHMMENFKRPYFATSLDDFWRRWHISLGAWMKDYVFYPIALSKGMRKFTTWTKKKFGKFWARTLPGVIANIIVFLLVGIWHGSELHYVYWGFYNGLVIGISMLLAPVFTKWKQVLHIDDKKQWYRIFCIIRTFVIVNIGWYFDRILLWKDSFKALYASAFKFGLSEFMNTMNPFFEIYPKKALLIALVGTVFLFVNSVLAECKMGGIGSIVEAKTSTRWAVCYFLIFITLLSFGVSTNAGGFLYANF